MFGRCRGVFKIFQNDDQLDFRGVDFSLMKIKNRAA